MTTKRLRDVFYWVGVILALACVVLIWTRNTGSAWRFDRFDLPASWLAGLMSIVAFLGAEYFDSPAAGPHVEDELQFEGLRQEF